MSRIAKTNDVFRFDILVFDTDGVTRKTGLVNGAFTKYLETQGAASGQTVTVTEIDSVNFPGGYAVTFTPNSDGYWACQLFHATYAPRGYFEDLDATPGGAKALDALISSRPDGAHYTNARGDLLSNLDAAVTTRATPAQILTNPARPILADASGNVTVGAFTAGAITSAAFAAGAIAGVGIAASAGNKIADHILRRTFANAHASSDGDAPSIRSLFGAVAKLVNKLAIVGGFLQIYYEDDVSLLGQQAVTATPGANPITQLATQ